MRTRVKICGITRIEDAELSVNAGVDAIGLVFYEKSPRFLSIRQAQEISRVVPAFVSRVALFKDANEHNVRAVLAQVEIDLIQFHGSETPGFCEQFERPYIKALGMKGPECDADYLIANGEKYHSSKALLLDSHAPGMAGGTGNTFDWSVIGAIDCPIVLAGGLTVDNVGEAISILRPYAVDVSSGVESAPGIKDKEKVQRFMQLVLSASR